MMQPLYYEYAVQSGEDSAAIIQKLYGWSPPSRRYGEILNTIRLLNPQVRDLDALWPGTVLRLSDRAVPGPLPPGLISNPVGGTAVVLAAGSAVSSLVLGKITATAYSTYLDEVDLVHGFGIDKVCR